MEILLSLQDRMSPVMLLVLLLSGLCNALIVAPAMAERGLGRESAWAWRGGVFYAFGGTLIFVTVRILLFFIY